MYGYSEPIPTSPATLQVFVGRSQSAHGPFVDKNGVNMVNNGGTLVIASHGDVFAPGGEGVFTDSKSGKDIFVYHYLHSQGAIAYKEANSSVGLNAIDWSSVSVICCFSSKCLNGDIVQGWPVLTSI